jgi:quinol monooxygenase YgiN
VRALLRLPDPANAARGNLRPKTAGNAKLGFLKLRENVTANENRKGQSYMTDEKVIMLIEAKIQPQRREELIDALREYLPLVRAEPGVEAFYVTERKEDPNTFVFYEIYKSQAAQDFHLRQDFTKKFLATLKNAQSADRVRTNLLELPL